MELENELKTKLQHDGWIGIGIVVGASALTAALITLAYKKFNH